MTNFTASLFFLDETGSVYVCIILENFYETNHLFSLQNLKDDNKKGALISSFESSRKEWTMLKNYKKRGQNVHF